MKTLGAAKISIIADAGGVSKGVAEARKEFNRLNTHLSHVKKMMATAFVAVGTSKVLAEFRDGIGAIAEEMERIDAIGKLSDRIGLDPKELIALRHAGSLTGVDEGKMDAIQGMTRRIAEAANGTGEAKQAIEQLGLSAVELARKSPGAAFADIAEAMDKVTSSGEKVRLAYKLFDADGVALVNTLRLGRDGLKESAREAEELGLVLDRMDIAQVEMANDAIYKAKQAFHGFMTSATIQLAPFAKVFADMFTGSIVNARKEIENSQSSIKGMANEFGILGQSILTAANALQVYLYYQTKNAQWVMKNAPWASQATLGFPSEKEYRDIEQWLENTEKHMFDVDWSDKIANNVRKAYSDIKSQIENEPINLQVNTSSSITDAKSSYEFSPTSGYKKKVDPLTYYRQRMGHNIDDLNYSKGVTDLIPAEALWEIEEAAERFRESIKTTADIVAEEAERIEMMRYYGGITNEEAKKGLEGLLDKYRDFDKQQGGGSTVAPAYTKGSREAYNAIVNAFSREPGKADEKQDRKSMVQSLNIIAQKIKAIEQKPAARNFDEVIVSDL